MSLALAVADHLIAGGTVTPPGLVPATRAFAIGDPQSTAEHFFAVLAANQLLGDDGFLRSDARLISIGDHFDFDTRHGGLALADAQVAGLRILSWLAAHSPDHIRIVLGNHDVSRVMELAGATDVRFAAAQPLARELADLRGRDPQAYAARVQAEWIPRFPELPSPGLVARDYESFTEAQRALVIRLLLDGRCVLATTATIGGVAVLLTHAAITTRELVQLDVAPTVPAIAAALEGVLAAAVDRVRADWLRGKLTPLSLAPLHVAGAVGGEDPELPEGGGLLYHRPSDPQREGGDPSWETDHHRPRRFHPKTLPRGVHQVAGHTGHGKSMSEMPGWHEPGLTTHPGIRTIVVADAISYRRGVHLIATALILIDPELNKLAGRPEDVELLALDA